MFDRIYSFFWRFKVQFLNFSDLISQDKERRFNMFFVKNTCFELAPLCYVISREPSKKSPKIGKNAKSNIFNSSISIYDI